MRTQETYSLFNKESHYYPKVNLLEAQLEFFEGRGWIHKKDRHCHVKLTMAVISNNVEMWNWDLIRQNWFQELYSKCSIMHYLLWDVLFHWAYSLLIKKLAEDDKTYTLFFTSLKIKNEDYRLTFYWQTVVQQHGCQSQ